MGHLGVKGKVHAVFIGIFTDWPIILLLTSPSSGGSQVWHTPAIMDTLV